MALDLVKPLSGELTLYVGGPGFGETQVLVLPDGRVVVVDVCLYDAGKKNLSVALLDALGVASIDLLVVTHTDLDHINGLPDLVARGAPKLVWRCPYDSDLRVLATKWKRAGDQRLRSLERALVLRPG